jgi:hypothetical protein
MNDTQLRHINSFEKGIESRLIPTQDVCMAGNDRHNPTYTLDTAAHRPPVDTLLGDFVKITLDNWKVNLQNLNPTRFFGARLFIWMEAFISARIKNGRRGVQLNSLARFNNWHCFLYEIYITFHTKLKWFQEPMLELHFINANQRCLTNDCKAPEQARVVARAAAAAAERTRVVESILPSKLKKHKSS